MASNTTTPRRQSCDRCHGQKLRCTRPDNRKTGACDRCLRKGVPCAYSSSLPKGRPALYRLNEMPAATPRPGLKGPGGTTRVDSPAVPPVQAAVVRPVNPDMPRTPMRPDQQHRAITPGSHADADDADREANVHVDMDLSGGDFSLPGSMDGFEDFWATLWAEDHTGDKMSGVIPRWTFDDLNSAAEPQLASLEVSGPLPNRSDGVSTGNSSSGTSQGHTHEYSLNLENDFAENTSTSSTSSMDSSSSSHDGCIVFSAEKNGLEHNIQHLSRLSTRLSQLLGPSRCFLAEALDSELHEPALQVQASIEAIFNSINTWLVDGSGNTNRPTASATSNLDLGPTNAFDLLHHVFSASNHLLEILPHVRGSIILSKPSPSITTTTTTASSSPQTSSSLSSSPHGERTTATMPQGGGSHQHSASVIHHLVHVCVTLLLNIYIAIIIALQRSADALSRSQQAPALRNPVEPHPTTDHVDAGSRVHLQLVSVVQLCSYFIRRQSQTLDAIKSSSQGASSSSSSSRENDRMRQSVSSDAACELRVAVEQRLRRLQEGLYIIS